MDARCDRIECNGDVAKSPACAQPNSVGLMHGVSCGETKSAEHGGRGYVKTEYNRPIKTEKHVSSDEKHVSSDDASDAYFYVIKAEVVSSRRTNEQCDVIKREERDSKELCSAIDNNAPLYVTESIECSVEDNVNEELGFVSELDECFTNDDSIGDFYVTEARTCASNVDVREKAYSGGADDEPSTVVQTEQRGRDECVSQPEEQVHSCASGGIRATNGSDVSLDANVCSEADETKSRHSRDATGRSRSSVNGLRRRSDRTNAAQRNVNETRYVVTAKPARPSTYVVTNTRGQMLPRLAPKPARVPHIAPKPARIRQQLEKSHKYHNPYACDVCGKCFPTQRTRALHQKDTQCKSVICQHDGQQSEKIQEYVNRRYVCDVCGTRFATRKIRTRHRRGTKCASGKAWLGVKQHLCSTNEQCDVIKREERDSKELCSVIDNNAPLYVTESIECSVEDNVNEELGFVSEPEECFTNDYGISDFYVTESRTCASNTDVHEDGYNGGADDEPSTVVQTEQRGRDDCDSQPEEQIHSCASGGIRATNGSDVSLDANVCSESDETKSRHSRDATGGSRSSVNGLRRRSDRTNAAQRNVNETRDGVTAKPARPSTYVVTNTRGQTLPRLAPKPARVPHLAPKPAHVPRLVTKPARVPHLAPKPARIPHLAPKPARIRQQLEKSHKYHNPYACDVCGKCFPTQRTRALHQKDTQCKSGICQNDGQQSEKIQEYVNRWYVCDVCGRRFATRKIRTRHRRETKCASGKAWLGVKQHLCSTNEQCDVIKREERDSKELCSAIDNNAPLYVTESIECSVEDNVNEELGFVSELDECFTNDNSIGDFYVTESRTCGSNVDVREDGYNGGTDDEPSTVVQTEQRGRDECVSQPEQQVQSCASGGIRATNRSNVSLDANVCSESDETKSRHCRDAGGGSRSSVNGLRGRSDRTNAAQRNVNETRDGVTAKPARPSTYVVTNTRGQTLHHLAPKPARIRQQLEKLHKYHNPFACDVCGKCFPTQRTRALHQKDTQCKSVICQNDGQQSEKIQEYVNRRHVCDVCGRRFATRKIRTRHRRETKCASGKAWMGVKQHLCSTNEQCDVIKREERDSKELCSVIDNNAPLYVTESIECSVEGNVNEELGCVSEPEECSTNDNGIGDFYVTESRTCGSNTDVREDGYSGGADGEPSTVVPTEQRGRDDCDSQPEEQVHSCASGGIRATNGSNVSLDANVCSESDETKSRLCRNAGGRSRSSVNGLRRHSDRTNAAQLNVNETRDAVKAKVVCPSTYVVTNTRGQPLPHLAPKPAHVPHLATKPACVPHPAPKPARVPKPASVRHQPEESHKYHNPYACDVCGKCFPTQQTWAAHQKNTRCKSGICQNDSQQSEKLQEYANRQYVCDVCGRRFATQQTRARHRIETKCASGNAWLGVKQHLCSTCGKLFPKASTLKLHSNVHTDERYTCPVCDKCYASRKVLRVHSQMHMVLEFTCDTCGEVFPRSSALVWHKQNRHQPKPFACSSCDKSFTLKSLLKQHESIHTGVKAYVCVACGSAFRTSSHLCNHKRQRHSDRDHVMCATCGKVLRGVNSLTIHMRYHTGEKPYVCAVCGTSFAASSTLQVHERIHTNTKPYTCSTCGKSFVTQSQNRTHEKSHSDVKPYSCNVCGQSFTLPHHRRAHEKTHARSGGKNEKK